MQRHITYALSPLPYELEIKENSKPFLSDKNSVLIEILSKQIKKNLGINPDIDTSGGTSDARFFAELKIPVVEFGLKNDTIHAVNDL